MKIIIEVDKKIYKEALVNGWLHAFGEELSVDDIMEPMDDKSDLVRALGFLDDDDFELEVEE